MLVTFCIVAYNEEKALPVLLEHLLKQDYDSKDIEVILVDGMSTDQTKAIMLDFQKEHEEKYNRILVLDNPKKLLGCGINVALKEFKGDAFLRIDAHAEIPEDFITKNVQILEEGHDIVGGTVSNYVKNETSWTRIINAAEDSMFGGSVADFRRSKGAKEVSTLAFGMYRAEVFKKTGFYNENLARTEDNDMHYRMKEKGYVFYYDPAIHSARETRPSFQKLLKQKYLNGYWIGLTMGVSPKCFSLYHFVPFVFVLAIIFTSVLALCGFKLFAALLWIAYALALLIMTAATLITSKVKWWGSIALPIMFFALHVGYGIGTLKGLIYMPFWRRKLK